MSDPSTSNGITRIFNSMRIEEMGWYGDFGRYIFQSNLKYFDVDIKKMFDYAMFFIIHDLGYDNAFFGEYDTKCFSADRHLTAKKERIGKKYQWIALFNILARVSDHYKMNNWFSSDSGDNTIFEGPWDLSIRDFDPTINMYSMKCMDAPFFPAFRDLTNRSVEESKVASITTEALNKWLREEDVLHIKMNSSLVQWDEKTNEWVCLTTYITSKYKNVMNQELVAWNNLYAFFMSEDQYNRIKNNFELGRTIITQGINSTHCIYSVFNREYPWAPSYATYKNYASVEASVKTGEVRKEYYPQISFPSNEIEEFLEGFIKNEDSNNNEMGPNSIYTDVPIEDDDFANSYEVECEEEIGTILHATTDFLWETEYDATKTTSSVCIDFPCAKIVEDLNLSQKKYDGFFFDENDKLAAFDTRLTGNGESVVIRKDLLDKFLSKSGLKLVWLCLSEKEFFENEYQISKKSNWEGLFRYENGKVGGEFHLLSVEQ